MCDWLPQEIQEIVKQHVWLANPMSSPVFRDTDMVRRYEDHERKLKACGHDTQEFVAAIERVRAAIRELDHVNEFMYEQFKREPFPFMKDVGADAGRVPYEQVIAEYAAKRDELNQRMYNGGELEGGAPS